MPVIFVNGLPKNITQEELRSLWEKMTAVVVGVKELDLSANEVTIWFLPDMWDFGLGEEIITIFVLGLFDRPERTPEVKDRLAGGLKNVIYSFFPAVKMGECSIYPFDPVWGFASFVRKK